MATARDESGELGSRDKVLVAATTMFAENPGRRLSVRAVAARAGVSTGSLRHHFPTQRALLDAVLGLIYDRVIPTDRIHDTSVPARDRLVDCLRQVLSMAGVGEQARQSMRTAYERFILPEPTEDLRAAYLSMEHEVLRRIEYWLTTLAKEGALHEGDNARRARFLMTVVDGLGLERALPADDAILRHETDTLYLAVDSVLRPIDRS
ncbi:TetR/AcrR family transcriptional regulator [Saccharomonospora piscinae]|uniref:TetR/AcrR family transcriptional regulator n=1 Tax=Saccharomonospora piscinae TaxID=687388 RepID=UPI0011064E71|nr:TetR/AcrR family transcriptional regulator [Saccharomonospora piscinae]TLW93352.1 TetR/AcrR family transcriptional regulator [Saccharomonospora piscinae]